MFNFQFTYVSTTFVANDKIMKIKFGTDGWRAIIAKDYTVANLHRVAEATAAYMKNEGMSTAVIGFDCRFAGQYFAKETAALLADRGIKVLMDERFASTPMVSYGVVKCEADLGIVITASHNPPSYNGYKLKSKHGGPCIPSEIAEVEALIPAKANEISQPYDALKAAGKIEMIDLEQLYIDHVEANFDLDAIRNSDISLAYDAMYGAGQNVIRRLFPDATLLHCEYNPSFMGQAPEPIHRNLTELSDTIKNNPSINLGLANDGDADRIGMYDENGDFVDSHHLLLLLLYYLHEYKHADGKVIVTFSVTNKMKQLAEIYGRDIDVTKIGFKYIAEIMRDTQVMVGGEESGGLAVAGHIPERDGIWMGLLIMEFMAKSGKSIKALINDIYEKVGSFAFDRYDLHISQEVKEQVIENCKNGVYTAFGPYQVQETESIDGFKYHIDDNTWTMIRPSGTEPVLRVYGQASDHGKVIQMLDQVKAVLLDE